MKNKYLYVVTYCLILLIFPFIQKKFAPLPNLRNLEFNSEVIDKYKLTKQDLRNETNYYWMKRVTIGNTFFISDSSNKRFQLTPISTWSLKNLNFSDLSDDFSNLIVKSSEIKKLNKSNYAIGTINDAYFAQACFINHNKYFFENYEPNVNVFQYSELKYWYGIFIKSMKKNIFFTNNKPEVCLLITSSVSNDFEESIDLVKKLINF